MNNLKRNLSIMVIFGSVILFNSCVFFSASYAPDDIALGLIQDLEQSDKFSFEKPAYRMDPPGSEPGAAIIFYPGAKVDPRAYVPLWERVRLEGYTVFIVDMPMDFAFLNINAAADVMKDNPGISRWLISGHSLGGAMAWEHLEKNHEKFQGAILIGSYPASSTDLSHLNMPAITIREESGLPGSNEKATAVKGNFPPGTEFVSIPGANHAQYGNYGIQKDDGQAEISRTKQQDITAAEILQFLELLP